LEIGFHKRQVSFLVVKIVKAAITHNEIVAITARKTITAVIVTMSFIPFPCPFRLLPKCNALQCL